MVRGYVRPDTRVLDIGCGRGGLIELLHCQVALAVGVDADRRSLVEHRAPVVRRVSGFVENLPFPDECFDLVICSWVFEHLVRPQQVFSEISRVLRNPDPSTGALEGHLVFLAPNAWHPLTWVSRLLERFGNRRVQLVERLYKRAETDTFPVVYRANTRRRIEELAMVAGLVPVGFSTVGDPSYLSFNEPLFRLATFVERLTPPSFRVHMVGDLMKRSPHDPSR
jgi:SAM-dependent methyltransferase